MVVKEESDFWLIEAKEILLGSSVEMTERRRILEYKSQAASEG